MPASLARPTGAGGNAGTKGWPVRAMLGFDEAWFNWLAVAHVPEEQRLGAVVSSPHRERPRHSQDHDRGLGAQASDRPVAARAGGRCTGRRRFASDTMNGGC